MCRYASLCGGGGARACVWRGGRCGRHDRRACTAQAGRCAHARSPRPQPPPPTAPCAAPPAADCPPHPTARPHLVLEDGAPHDHLVANVASRRKLCVHVHKQLLGVPRELAAQVGREVEHDVGLGQGEGVGRTACVGGWRWSVCGGGPPSRLPRRAAAPAAERTLSCPNSRCSPSAPMYVTSTTGFET